MVALRFPGARWLALLATTAAVSLGVETSHVIAISGRIEDDRFLPEHLVRLDGGPDFYAPAAVIAPGGRGAHPAARDLAAARRRTDAGPGGGAGPAPFVRHSLETAPRTPLQVPAPIS